VIVIPSESRSLSSVHYSLGQNSDFSTLSNGLATMAQKTRLVPDQSLSVGTSTVVDEGLEKGWFG
jgi:hypothetical protein